MKNKDRILRKCAGAAAMVLAMGWLAGSCWCADTEKAVEVMWTHDLHSYLDSYTVNEDGENKNVGGIARIKTVIDGRRTENPDLLLLDAGDFSMGTLYHTVFCKEAIEYRMLGELGMDALTLGNHEFDFGSEGLAQMLSSASEQNDDLPPLALCNADWEHSLPGAQQIRDAAEKCGLKPYQMVEKDGVSIAVIGVFGKDALECAPTCEVTFSDPVESVKKTVKEISEKEQADMIVCISHSGTSEQEKQSEDQILAREVPELDLIISGHSHSVLEQPMIEGDTVIASCGAYGRYIGDLEMNRKEDGRWELGDYELISIDDSIKADPDIEQELDTFRDRVDAQYLGQFGYQADQVLAENNIAFEGVDDLYTQHTEHLLGNLMSDAYRYTVDRDGTEERTVDVAVVPSGVVRSSYAEGPITVAQVFESFSLGVGSDRIAGYPLVSVYLTGDELKTAAEVDASVSDLMPSARLYLSGLSFSYNPHRMILNKLTEAKLNPDLCSDTETEIEPKKLYRVVADLYTARMLGAVSSKSMGILKLVPKYADGTVVEDYEDCIIRDADGKEIKAWTAIAGYLESFDKNKEGISQIPEYYAVLHGRKIVEDDGSLKAVLGHPGKYAWMIYGVAAAAIVVLVLLIMAVIKIVKRIRRKRSERREQLKRK